MKDGFIRVAASTPEVKVADVEYNREQICCKIIEGRERGAKIMVFPELVLTGYTCGELFNQKPLLTKAREELKKLVDFTAGSDMLVFAGVRPNYSEFYELRYFNPGFEKPVAVPWEDGYVLMGSKILFNCANVENLVVGAEICEDVWVLNPPSIGHASAGATVIVNCSASDETTGKSDYRRSLISGQSARLLCGYIYANAGEGESTQDLVFGGQNIIAENGTMLAESRRFENETVYADMDLERLECERRRMTTYQTAGRENYVFIDFSLYEDENRPERFIDPSPFVPQDEESRNRRCEEIVSIQAMGLKKRLKHTGCRSAVIGISGGLDSTLALLVTVRAFDLLGLARDKIICVTMPCFGTTDRTYHNACYLTKKLGASLLEVDIKDAVANHFRDIGHDSSVHDVTYGTARNGPRS